MTKQLVIILITLLLITACGTIRTKTDPSALIKEIYKGTDGLVMNFMLGAPPEEVYEKSSFQLNLELENKGAYNIENGLISIGLEKDYMLASNWFRDDFSRVIGDSKAQFNLEGKSQTNPKGDKRVISLKINTLNIKEEMSEKHESTIMATACYKYQTKLIETICIDTDVYNLKPKEKVCQVQDITLSDQGAPIAVVKIEESIQPAGDGNQFKPEFTIHIENKGNGQAIKDSQDIIDKACSAESLSYEDLNLVTVSVSLPGPTGNPRQLKCEPTESEEEKQAFVKLKENKGFARCVLEEGINLEEGTFLSPLTIILDYGYSFTISKPVTITKILTY